MSDIKDIDITNDTDWLWPDDESLPLLRCKCGQEFESWDFVLGVERNYAEECPNCKRKLYWRSRVWVFERLDG